MEGGARAAKLAFSVGPQRDTALQKLPAHTHTHIHTHDTSAILRAI